MKAKKNILASFIIKGGSVLTSLALVSITINYIPPVEYGIWLTLSSIIVWFNFFDIGLGNGLKNKIAEALANNDKLLVRIYISSTYLVLGFISILLYGLFLISNQFISWVKVVNTNPVLESELSLAALILFSAFTIQFVLQLVNVVCDATQNSKLSALSLFFGNLLSLLLIYLLTKTTNGSIVYLCFAISVSPLIVFSVFSVILYSTKFRDFRPSLKLAKFSYAKDIARLGLKFFFIQLGLILFYNANNIIIAQTSGPEAVTPYNIAFKYFGVITMLSGIIMTPFWSAFTDAYTRQDFKWIKSTVKRLEKICLILLALCLLMVVMSSYAYELWLGDKVFVPLTLSVVLAFYTIVNLYRTIYCFYLNGIGKIGLQLYLVISAGLLNIPIALYFGSLWGATGVILATSILCVICGIFEKIQYHKLVNGTASGIWNR
ncbi:MATE family efflux transporter [Pontibacter sp. BT310]|uniref:MATE family efflux transporter n=1 Tax=Pontibacter populi TaxID=890055 RepID=A0ABS6XB96_9BACT|nr:MULTISPECIES: MATE family efflux transporter [Pontibacter]MBJ6118423.1 MATE family efflux transporter [Pontibacter sp. BT310]MBR0570851.1 MATE family efflux transporter [Microvirga sp. STS03]MBW3365277.1 MATE family efflux transporter [Pontibacter populi]